jgi:uncharacterized membrane protein
MCVPPQSDGLQTAWPGAAVAVALLPRWIIIEAGLAAAGRLDAITMKRGA